MAFGAVRDIARDDLSDDPCPVGTRLLFSRAPRAPRRSDTNEGRRREEHEMVRRFVKIDF